MPSVLGPPSSYRRAGTSDLVVDSPYRSRAVNVWVLYAHTASMSATRPWAAKARSIASETRAPSMPLTAASAEVPWLLALEVPRLSCSTPRAHLPATPRERPSRRFRLAYFASKPCHPHVPVVVAGVPAILPITIVDHRPHIRSLWEGKCQRAILATAQRASRP